MAEEVRGGFNTFHKGINFKVNPRARLGICFAYDDVSVERVSHYSTGIPHLHILVCVCVGVCNTRHMLRLLFRGTLFSFPTRSFVPFITVLSLFFIFHICLFHTDSIIIFAKIFFLFIPEKKSPMFYSFRLFLSFLFFGFYLLLSNLFLVFSFCFHFHHFWHRNFLFSLFFFLFFYKQFPRFLDLTFMFLISIFIFF